MTAVLFAAGVGACAVFAAFDAATCRRRNANRAYTRRLAKRKSRR